VRYEIVVQFDCDEDAYMEHIAESISAIMNSTLPYMVDNVSIDYYVFSDEDEDDEWAS
jgi:Tfp pilus assembly PilM family ATPase